MDISLDWAIAIVLTLLLALVCKLTARRLNSQVDTMFDGMADTRTQRFFMVFDGQPQPISVTDAVKLIDESGGNLEIQGTYNQRPVKVIVKTTEYSNKMSQDVVAGHSYVMPCSSTMKFHISKRNNEDISAELEEVKSLPEKLSGINVLTNNTKSCLEFLDNPDITDYIAHLINSSNIKSLSADGLELRFEDEEPQAGESIIRIKTLFETQYKLASALEELC